MIKVGPSSILIFCFLKAFLSMYAYNNHLHIYSIIYSLLFLCFVVLTNLANCDRILSFVFENRVQGISKSLLDWLIQYRRPMEQRIVLFIHTYVIYALVVKNPFYIFTLFYPLPFNYFHFNISYNGSLFFVFLIQRFCHNRVDHVYQ